MSTQAPERALQSLRKAEGNVGLVLSLDFDRSKFQLRAFSFGTAPFFPGFHCDWLTLPPKHLSFWVKLSWWLPVPYVGSASICPNYGCHVSVVLARGEE